MYAQNEANDKLDWMYKGATGLVDREEYLLGRKIDKTLEQINTEEKQKELGVSQPKNHVEHECIPPSIRDYKLQVGDQVDLQTKLQEDPLVAIKKREEETRRQFLQNPIQLKKLQTVLIKRAKKKKKKKSKRKRASSDDDSDSDIDTKIAERLKLLKGNEVDLNACSKSEDEEDAIDAILLCKLNKLRNKLSEADLKHILEDKKSSQSSGNEDSDCNKASASNRKLYRQRKPYNDNGSDSDNEYKKRQQARSFKYNSRNLAGDATKKEHTVTSKGNPRDLSRNHFKKKQLTEEEKERKLREMMQNASWRDTERVRNVKQYREEDSKESKQKEYNPDFIHKELLKSANSSSVESRIKANINSIQRSGSDMNKHFSRRH